ncbi:HBS1-like protein [Orussus abietinus]|uniref:HBS1-like protein n=1 Tax=Orussus abietinus TaxID=222816 RepID=UPI000625BDD7|nr:HBS1-like protein [Orussus abietinus]
MSRHRDVRSMNYSDEYDGYDDVYGHSVPDDDYCVSPGVEQFLYDRAKKQDISSFLTEADIEEGNEDAQELSTGRYKTLQLSDSDKAKLLSSIKVIRDIVGDIISDSVLSRRLIETNFNTEVVLDAILKELPPKGQTPLKKELNTHIGNKISTKPTIQLASPGVKVVPAATKTIVKGFDLSGSENPDLLYPRLESPRAQSPASDRNSPDNRRKNEGFQKEKKTLSSKAGTPRRRSPASGRTTPELESKSKYSDNKTDVLTLYKSKRATSKDQLNLVVVGHVDAGKSTLLGRLLCDLGQIPSRVMHKHQQESKKIGKQSFAYAWVLDETGEERERGITMDVGHSKFETETKNIALLDAPGHKDFIPNMISGATRADVALLVVDATRGEFETGFDSGGQTREHALLLRSLGVNQLAVVVNKLDTVDWSQDRFNEIVEKLSTFLRQAGYKDSVTFVPCSGLSGENIVASPTAEGLSKWYNGPTLIDVIDSFKCPERPISKPFRLSVNDIFKGTGSGFCVSGPVETGIVSIGDKVLVMPHNEVGSVKALQMDDISITNAFAGDHVAVTLSGIDQQNVVIGDILCHVQNPVLTTTCFQAHIVTFAIAIPITKGLPVVVHQQSLVEPAVITKLIAHLHKSTGEVVKKYPRCLAKNSSAIVEISTQRPICMELYREIKQLGRIMLRVDGTTIAAGLVTKIK